MKKVLLVVLCCMCFCGCGEKKDEKKEKGNNQEIIDYVRNHHSKEWEFGVTKLSINEGKLSIKMNNVEHWTECATSSKKFTEQLVSGDYSSAGIKEVEFECLDSSSKNNSYVSIKNLSNVNNDFYKDATIMDANKTVISQTLEDGLKQLEKEFKDECKSYTYKEIFRNPDNYKGKKMKITGEVIQVIDADDYFQLRVDMTKNEYDYYDDTIFVQINKDKFNGRIIEDDIITFWGLNAGTVSYETVMGDETTIPAMEAYYAELVK